MISLLPDCFNNNNNQKQSGGDLSTIFPLFLIEIIIWTILRFLSLDY